jgi:hypothetical protein
MGPRAVSTSSKTITYMSIQRLWSGLRIGNKMVSFKTLISVAKFPGNKVNLVIKQKGSH